MKICFYKETGVDHDGHMAAWRGLASLLGAKLCVINWMNVEDDEDFSGIEVYSHVEAVRAAHPNHVHIYFMEGGETPVAEYSPPAAEVVYYFGRNSRGFRTDLDENVTHMSVSLPGGDLWAHEAAVSAMGLIYG